MAFPSSRCCFAAVFVIATLVPCVFAQRGGVVDPSRAGGAVDMSNAGSPVMERNSSPRSVFVSGKVLFQGGGLAQQVLIERICNGMVRREGYTNAKGSFQFELGRNSTERDASQSDSDRMVANKMARSTPAGGAEVRFDDCELRASLPGFMSSTVPMRVDNDVSELQVATIVLKKLGGVEGSVVSVTTMSVPKEAREAFDRGRKEGTEKKFDEAVKDLNKAVTIYPQYAAAWSLMAEIHRLQNQFEPARKEYAQALAADPKFVSPYFGLAAMAVVENKWTEAAQLTDQLIQLNSFAYPMAYFFNAAANLNLGKLDAAEQSARKFQEVDKAHSRPDIALLLANILTGKHQYAEAAQLYRDYLALKPDAPNADTLKKEVQRLDGLSAAKQ
ncbi:MAG TPA: tetratricopeptide repeat protein [Candidatus Angelobacter sp.]|nr:tetratricopeptide repeat protein [Candidatus Angelobacter sp.]